MEINEAFFLTYSESLFKAISNNSGGLYKPKTQAKMKFGKPQLDENGAERKRDMFSPDYQLKRKQREVNHLLKPIGLPFSMYGGISKRSNIENAQMHVDSKFFLTIDLKNYFNNISNDQVYQTLIGYGINKRISRAITRISTVNYALPQGAPTSTMLANLVFASTAIELEALCAKRKIIFTNFVDDLTFSSKKDFKQLIPQILALLKKNGFVVNQKKSIIEDGDVR
ncbi:reverse transcriptase family protein [Mucilaginibacter lutimaris]|uniref:RNA-directed DNA polymerase n=1 Tax=Mucilaginibacter lutimaris TaxID=931629 RepID=A0ABW2ZHW7_9SPHI